MLAVYLQTLLSFRAYHRLALTRRAVRVGFAVFIFLLSFIVFYFFASGYIRKNLPIFLKNFPQITIEKGTLTAPATPVVAPLPGGNFSLAFDKARTTPPSFNEMVEKQWLMLLAHNTLYILSSNTVRSQQLPADLSFTSSQEFLAKEQSSIALFLKLASFFFALLFIPLAMGFGFCTACTVGLIFNLITRRSVPTGYIVRWSIFLLGPLSLLWYVRLWFSIPLFTLTQIVLCIIYMQQIFNTLPEAPSHVNKTNPFL